MNLDVKNQLVADAKASIETGNVEGFVNQMVNFVEETEARIKKDYEELKNEKDAKVLAQRGYVTLAKDEIAFYDALVSQAQNGVANIPAAIPETLFNRVFEDLVTRHPLLAHVNYTQTKSVAGKIVVNTGITGTASWGELCAAISSEISSGFAAKEVDMNKLSAYMLLCKTILDMGYTWLDRYVVECLGEVIAVALENAIISGDGSNKPLGLDRVIAAYGSTQTIPATQKSKVALNDLSATSLAGIAATLTNNGKRTLGKMIMVVNPSDYFAKIIPAIRVLNVDGKWVEYLPFDMEIIPSVAVTANDAVIFMDKGYELFVGLGKDGKIEKSDEFKFLDDVRTYKAKMVAGGLPKDNTISVLCNITNLAPVYATVNTIAA